MNRREKPMGLPLAQRWYEAERAEQGVTLIREIHVAPGVCSNIWLVEGSERALLVDTGTGLGPLRATVESLTDRPIVAVATVGYYDHAGGLHQFDERLIHRLDAGRVADPSPRKNVSDKYVTWEAFDALPYPGFKPARYVLASAPPTRTLEEGDRIDLGDRRFEVLHLPGITQGTIGLFEQDTGILFTGEALADDGRGIYDGEPADYTDDADRKAFRASLKRMTTLPVSLVYPGHYARFDKARLEAIVEDYLAGRLGSLYA